MLRAIAIRFIFRVNTPRRRLTDSRSYSAPWARSHASARLGHSAGQRDHENHRRLPPADVSRRELHDSCFRNKADRRSHVCRTAPVPVLTLSVQYAERRETAPTNGGTAAVRSNGSGGTQLCGFAAGHRGKWHVGCRRRENGASYAVAGMSMEQTGRRSEALLWSSYAVGMELARKECTVLPRGTRV